MPDTPAPTPTPALTDEQVEDLRIEIVETGAGLALRQARLTRYTAAVIARAKREAAEEIAQGIETMPIAGFNGETLTWLKVAREMCAALARKVGADHA